MKNMIITLTTLLSFASQINSQNLEPRLFYNLYVDTTDDRRTWHTLDLILLYENKMYSFLLRDSENSCYCYYNESKSVDKNIEYAMTKVQEEKLKLYKDYIYSKPTHNGIQIKTLKDSSVIDTSLTSNIFITESMLIFLVNTYHQYKKDPIHADAKGVFDAAIYREYSRKKTKQWLKNIQELL